MLQSLGKVTVSVAGTPERITKNEANPAAYFPAHALMVQVLFGNTGKVYVGLSNLNKSTGGGVLAVLGVPTANLIPAYSATVSYAPGALNVNELFIDVDVSGEGAQVSAVVA